MRRPAEQSCERPLRIGNRMGIELSHAFGRTPFALRGTQIEEWRPSPRTITSSSSSPAVAVSSSSSLISGKSSGSPVRSTFAGPNGASGAGG